MTRLSCVGIALLASPLAHGCGLALRCREGRAVAPAAFQRVEAVIAHQSGRQRMMLAATFRADPDDAVVWLVPVPAAAEQVRVRPTRVFPRLHGHDPYWGARVWVHSFLLVARATQLYPMLFEWVFLPGLGPRLRSPSSLVRGDAAPVLVSTLSAASSGALVESLGRQGVAVSPGQLARLDPYFRHGTAVSFVVALAGAQDGHAPQTQCIRLFVDFPSRRAVYPMPPREGRGVSLAGTTLCLIGYARPAAAAGFEVWHRLQSRFDPAVARDFTASLPEERVPCTIVRGTGTLAGPRPDLHFEPVQPLSMAYAAFIEGLSHRLVVAFGMRLALVVALSYLSAGAAGLVLFGRWRGYAALGLLNLVTLLGMAIIVSHHSGPRDKGWRWPHFATWAAGRNFCLLFSVLFVLMSVAAQYLLTLPL